MAKSRPTAPKRRTYQSNSPSKPTTIFALPFCAKANRGQRKRAPSYWEVPACDDYLRGCSIGYEYAAHFVQYLKDNPCYVGSNALGLIAGSMDFQDQTGAKGYRVGFFSFLEYFIHNQAKQTNVYEFSDKLSALELRAYDLPGAKDQIH